MKTRVQSFLNRCALLPLFAALALVPGARAADIFRNNVNNTLNQGASWIGGVAPTNSDVGVWTNGAYTTGVAMGASLDWAGIRIADIAGALTINNTAGILLTNGASGIDMSAAAQNLTFSGNIFLGSAQTWNIATGRKLTLNTGTSSSGWTTSTLTIQGGGIVALAQNQSKYTNDIVINGGRVSAEATSSSTGANTLGTPTVFGILDPTRTITVTNGGALMLTNANQIFGEPNNIAEASRAPKIVIDGSYFAVGANVTAGGNGGNNMLGKIVLRNGGDMQVLQAFGYTEGQELSDLVTVEAGTVLTNSIIRSTPGMYKSTINMGYKTSGFGAAFDVADATGDEGVDLNVPAILGDRRGGGASQLRKLGAGTMLLSGTNIYSGATVISNGVLVAGGAEIAGASGPFGKATAAGNIQFYGGTLKYSASNQFDYSGRYSTAAGQPIRIDTAGQSVTNATALTSSGGTLTKLGSGTLVLNAASTYSGNTEVRAGTLALGASGSIAGTPQITVYDGATVDVTGRAGYTIASGQTLAGGSTNGTATIYANGYKLTLTNGALAAFQADGTSATNGLVSVTGDVDLYGNAITVNVTNGPLPVGRYPLLSCTGTMTGSANVLPTINGALGAGLEKYIETSNNVVTLVVYVLPPTPATITAQPTNTTVNVGTSATFQIQVTGTVPITYRWQTNGVDFANATNATFTLSNVGTNLNGATVRCYVSNPYTNNLASDLVTLTVLWSPLLITSQPTNTTVGVGTSATFQIQATGSAPITYRWQTNNVDVANATNATFTLSNVGTNLNGTTVRCYVSNPVTANLSSDVVTLTVQWYPVVITSQPTNTTVGVGTSATFTIQTTGTAPITYQWQTNGVDFANATNATFTLSNVGTNLNGATVQCYVDNDYTNSYSSAVVTLTVVTLPVLITAQPTSQSAFEGASATFTIQTTGTAPITYQWQTNGVDFANATNATFTITNVVASLNGATVQCYVDNDYTNSYSSAVVTLTVLSDVNPRVFASLSEAPTTTNVGTLQGFGVYATNGGYPVLSTNVPTGGSAPSNNVGSVDVGTSGAARGVDYTNFAYGGTLQGMKAVTICGWVNCRDIAVGAGGNRIAYSLDAASKGFDLVHLANGQLQLGVNAWPDASPAKSLVGAITANASGTNSNWVYFAVTYDGQLTSTNVNFYIGSGSQTAALNTNLTYNAGTMPSAGPLTIGCPNQYAFFRSDGSRNFRGSIDEVKVYGRVLSLAEIQAEQTALPQPQAGGGTPPVAAFTAAPTSGYTPLLVNFTNTSTGGAIVSGLWSFGDGATSADMVSVPVTHTYTVAGVYTAVLSVTNASGVSSATNTITALVHPTLISTKLGGGQIQFSWISGDSFQLQSRTNLVLGSWANVTNTPTVVGTTNTVVLLTTNRTEYFRVKH